MKIIKQIAITALALMISASSSLAFIGQKNIRVDSPDSWEKTDPLGIDGGVNVYAYANLNPLFFVDPLGLCGSEGGAWYQNEALPGSTWQDLGMNASYAAQGLLRSPVDMAVGAFKTVQGLGAYAGNMSVDPGGTLAATAGTIRNIPSAIASWANDPQAIGSTVGQFGLGLGAAKIAQGMRTTTPRVGQKIYRVYGGDSIPGGASWSPVNPGKVSNYRNVAGLPSGGVSGYNNTGRFVIEGRLADPSKVLRIRSALPLDGNSGGVSEFVIPNWMNNGAVNVNNVSGVNPRF